MEKHLFKKELPEVISYPIFLFFTSLKSEFIFKSSCTICSVMYLQVQSHAIYLFPKWRRHTDTEERSVVLK